MAYAKPQNMDFKWQVARKIDRLDLGTFAALEFFYRNAIIFGLVRAIDPEESDQDQDQAGPARTPIPALITSIDARISALLEYDTTAILLGKTNLKEVREFQTKTMSAFYELGEVIYRCKITDNVRTQETEAP